MSLANFLSNIRPALPLFCYFQHKSGGKRVVIITAFGAQDADVLRRFYEQDQNSLYVENLPQDIPSKDLRAAALDACGAATAQTVRVAE